MRERRCGLLSVRYTMCTAVLATSLSSFPVAADELTLGLSVVEYGGAIGSTLITQYQDRHKVETTPDDYSRLAQQVQAKINEGRASSGVVAAYFNMQSATLTYAAILDPEPLSKSTAAVAAWGSKLAGDAITQNILDKAQEGARGILAQGLKESQLTSQQLRAMSADQLRLRVRNLQIGGRKLKDIFQDNPKALQMLEAQSVDLAINLGVENLARTAAIGTDVIAIKSKIASFQSNLEAYQDEMSTRMSKVEAGLGALAQSAEIANAKLDALKAQVAGNTTAIRSLAAVSYSGWSTTQKLQAVESGLFPDLAGQMRVKLIDSLKAQQSFESTVATIQSAANTFGNLATIAGNLDVPGDVVNGLQVAQAVAGSVAKFATGDMLGSIAGLTSLVGLGAPDAAAQRHAETMKYLRHAFAEVNRKLDTVIDLQVKTLTAIAELAKAQELFKKEVTQQLDRIETTVLQNQQILQNIIIHRWSACYALFYGTVLNGQFEIPDRDFLVRLLKARNLSTFAADCYGQFATFLDANVKPVNWAGDIIAAELFPTDQIIDDVEFQKVMKAYQLQKTKAFTTARDFLLRSIRSPMLPKQAEGQVMARLMQPATDVDTSHRLDAVFAKDDVHKRFDSFKCDDTAALSASLADLLCVGLLPRAPKPPVIGRFQTILKAPLIGPNAYWLMDMGISLSTIIDFASRSDDGSFRFVSADHVGKFVTKGPTSDMMTALREGKGSELLQKLRWLSDVTVLQQSLIYGDYLAGLIEQVLYDPEKRTLTVDSTDLETRELKHLGLMAMKANPVLARNVLIKALRHAIEDGSGGANKAAALSYRQTYFALGLSDYTGSNPCTGPAFAKAKLANLFPNFTFEYRVTKEEKDTADKRECPLEIAESFSEDSSTPGYGAGVSVRIEDFYVTVPSPSVVARGVYEQGDGLRLALAYRDRVSQALIDRNLGAALTASLPAMATPTRRADLATQLLSKAWNWKVRDKTM